MAINGQDDGLHGLEPVRHSSAVADTAKAIKKLILSLREEDWFIGSEDDLIRRLKVSQPTFRQAARLLESEEMLTVKRGVGGGYFARRPSAEVVARLAATYLVMHGAPLADVVASGQVLEREVIRLLVANPDALHRRRLLDLATKLCSENYQSGSNVIRAIHAFWRLAGELAGNQSLGLYLLSAQAFGAITSAYVLEIAEGVDFLDTLNDVAKAVAAGKDIEAMKALSRFADKITDWTARSS